MVPVSIGVPLQHPLASKEVLSVEDLYGYELVVAREHFSHNGDDLYEDLCRKHPQIKVQATAGYEYEEFNDIAADNKLIVLNKSIKNLHPFIKNISIDWEYKAPKGILYSLNPSEKVHQFIKKVKEMRDNGKLNIP